jgi:hypothetical protein
MPNRYGTGIPVGLTRYARRPLRPARSGTGIPAPPEDAPPPPGDSTPPTIVTFWVDPLTVEAGGTAQLTVLATDNDLVDVIEVLVDAGTMTRLTDDTFHYQG